MSIVVNNKEAKKMIREHRGVVTVGVNTPNDVIMLRISKTEAYYFLDACDDYHIHVYGDENNLSFTPDE